MPAEPVSVAVALADKIDTLTGFWAIDEKPTGSKDPYALRRAALGVIRLVTTNDVKLDFKQLGEIAWTRLVEDLATKFHARILLIEDDCYILQPRQTATHVGNAPFPPFSIEEAKSAWTFFNRNEGNFEDSNALVLELDPRGGWGEVEIVPLAKVITDLLAFLHDRLKVTLRDQGVSHDIIDACLAMPGNDDLTLLVKRATALAATLKTEDGANLIQGFKRANNILSQAEAKDGVEYSYGADLKFAETDAERALFQALDKAEATITPAMDSEDFAAAMAAMAALRAPLDAFFTAVQVNSDNPIIRRNRLNLLHRIRTICSGVADLTRIEG